MPGARARRRLFSCRRRLRRCAEHGAVRRRQLGITATTIQIPRSRVRELDLLVDQAVEVQSAQHGSPAAAAGVQPGDLIYAINDRLVASVDDIHRILSAAPAESRLILSIVRGHRLEELAID